MNPPSPPNSETAQGRVVLDCAAVQRALTRLAHEIIERESPLEQVVILGIQRGGVAIGRRLAELVADLAGRPVPHGALDVSFYRDDFGQRLPDPEATLLPCDLTDRIVVLVDNVLYSGRTVRAAMDAVNDCGRPARVRLAVLVDRGHRELPVSPDYVGKNLPTAPGERVRATLDGVTVYPPRT
jgi:pyrimidine operon attenuation protein/uracil phosphoribosyltransferase